MMRRKLQTENQIGAWPEHLRCRSAALRAGATSEERFSKFAAG